MKKVPLVQQYGGGPLNEEKKGAIKEISSSYSRRKKEENISPSYPGASSHFDHFILTNDMLDFQNRNFGTFT